MTDLRDLAHRLVSGEELKGEQAQTIMALATDAAPWQLWVQLALAYLELGQLEAAADILQQLLERELQLCETVAGRSYEALDKIRQNDFVFDDLDDRWQKLAFTLYTMLAADAAQARAAIDKMKEE